MRRWSFLERARVLDESPVEKRVREARLWAMGHGRQVIEAAVADGERLSRWAALGDRAAHLAAMLQTSRTEGGLVWTREAERPDGMRPSWWADDPPPWSELFFVGCGVTVGFPGGEAKIVTGEFAPPGSTDPEPTEDWQMVAVPAGRGFEVYAPNGWRWVPDSDCVAPVVKELDRVPVTRDGLSALAEVVESIRPIRPDRRAFPILPARMAMVHRDDARAGRLFAPAARPNPQRGGSEVLPGFGPLRSEVMRTPALPLTLYDLGGGRSMTRGRGAPLALRIFVEMVLSVPWEVRDRGAAFPLDPVRLRDFIRWLYPHPREWRLSKDWPRLRDALAALGSPQALIPFEHADGRSWLRQVVVVTEFPEGNARLDDWLHFAVNPLPGSGVGPRVNRERLRYWGAHSAPAYRALLGLAYLWFEPGKTRMPAPGAKRGHWIQISDPSRYAPLSDAEVVGLCYPVGDASGRRYRKRRERAWEVLELLAAEGDCRIEDKRILPPPWMFEPDPESRG